MLKINNISYSLRSGRQILENINFSAEPGEICAIIGPNGAGKSTLLKITAGLLRPDHGDVSIYNDSIKNMPRKNIAKMIAYLPQVSNSVPSLVSDAVLLGRSPYIGWYPSSDDIEKAEQVMYETGISDLRDKCVTEISGGEFQKVMIARAIAQDAPVLLMDEPVNHLDVKNKIEIMETAGALTQSKNLITLIVLHDLNLAVQYADRLVVLSDGKLADWCGSKKISESLIESIYGVSAKMVNIDNRQYVLF